MTTEQLLEHHAQLTELARRLMENKNHDYTAGGHALANFDIVEQLGICSADIGIMTRLTDKFKRLATFVSGAQLLVKNESVKDTIIDAINYLVILDAYIDSKIEAAPPKATTRNKYE